MKLRHLLLSSLIILAAACSKDDGDDVEIRHYIPSTEYAKRLEVPALLSNGTTQFISHSTVINGDTVMTYCLEYDLTRNHSRWVAFRFDGLTRKIDSQRSDTWADDPELNSQYHIGAGTFTGGVRGHICASHDRRYSQQANMQTFYMTNMTPMNYDFNGDYWTAFESHVQSLGRSTSFADTLYVVKGGTLLNTKGTAWSSAGKAMPIPAYYFIALLKVKAGQYKSIGFWIEHKDYGRDGTSSDVRAAAVKIDKLEELTRIDFFPNLRDDIETTVESSYSLSEWQL